MHKLYDEIRKYPPLDYKILIPEQKELNRFSTIASHDRSAFFKKLIYYLGAIPYVFYQLHDGVVIPADTDLIFAAQHIISTEKPWVVDVEHVGTLSGYSDLTLVKGILLKKLKEKQCKKILAWSDWSKRTIVKSFKDEELKSKIEVVRYTVNPKLEKTKRENSVIQLFFLGTVNPGTQMNFEYKGLYETVSSFLKLQEEYKNKIKLVIRSKIPPDLKQKISVNPGIEIYENYLKPEEMKNLFLTSDVFPHIGYEVANLSIFEAMSYGLPVIAMDLFNTGELIQHLKNGLLIRPDDIRPFYTKEELPNERSDKFSTAMRKSRQSITSKLTDSIRLLIEDEHMRKKLGDEAAKTIEDGEFSIKQRNKLLKDIFDNALK